MKFIVEREHLLKNLQHVISPLGGRIALPILGNILLQVKKGKLMLTVTDLEIEMMVSIVLYKPYKEGTITVSARKLFDIFRCFIVGAEISVTLEGERVLVRSGRSRFLLSTLPAEEFPNLENWKSEVTLNIPQVMLKRLIETTQFSMAYKDVRYYLNGMLFETEGEELRMVATDGHRLAVCSMKIRTPMQFHSAIVPRKGVIELVRLLEGSDAELQLQISSNSIRAYVGDFIFTSKLLSGCFPDYRCVLPKNPDKKLEASCDILKQAFSRVAILSNDKLRAVRLHISSNQMKITANNFEKEEAEEIIDVLYQGADIEIGFNVIYLLDVLNSLKCKEVRLLLTDSVSGVQIENSIKKTGIYIIMPMIL